VDQGFCRKGKTVLLIGTLRELTARSESNFNEPFAILFLPPRYRHKAEYGNSSLTRPDLDVAMPGKKGLQNADIGLCRAEPQAVGSGEWCHPTSWA
jgi:hypothetical protein